MLATSWGFATAGVIGLVVCRLAYEGALERARAWGELVKSAFDLYLPDLANKIGYELPRTACERRRFWDAVNSSFLYQEPMTPEMWQVAGLESMRSLEQKRSDDDGQRRDSDNEDTEQ
jgi:hypothetical protein